MLSALHANVPCLQKGKEVLKAEKNSLTLVNAELATKPKNFPFIARARREMKNASSVSMPPLGLLIGVGGKTPSKRENGGLPGGALLPRKHPTINSLC